MLKPQNNYILLERIDPKEFSGTMIELPSSTMKGCKFGKIVELSSRFFHKDDKAVYVEVGDKVVYKESDAEQIEYKGVVYHAVKVDLLVAIVEGKK